MNKIVGFHFASDYQLLLEFNDGTTKMINFEPLIGKGISKPLVDVEFFKKVAIDNGGGLEWPNGMDFCPNYLRDYIPAVESQVA